MALGLHGEENETVARFRANLGNILNNLGQFAEAEQLLRAGLLVLRRLRGDEDLALVTHGNNLIITLRALGKLDEAETLARGALASARRRRPAGDAEVATALAMLCSIKLEQRQYAGAEPIARECLAIRADKMPGHWRTYHTMSLLGGALAGQGKHEEAEPLLREGYERMDLAQAGAKTKQQALERLIQHYEAWGKPDEAAKWRRLLGDGSGK
jgi:tetratricopeptide (TPR) repeat protein